MGQLEDVLRTAVNTWECDEMGHLNVRHYPARESESVRVLLARCGATPARLRAQGLRLRFTDTHLRFHREMRPGTAFAGRAGFVSIAGDALQTYCELIGVRTGNTLHGSMLGRVSLCDVATGQPVPFDADLLRAAEAYRVDVPDHGQPRGIERTAAQATPTLEQAKALGMSPAYLGVVDPQLVDEYGYGIPAGLVARVSDGVQHFFEVTEQRSKPGIGGAVLEMRVAVRDDYRVGDHLAIHSALTELGDKTRRFCHWFFNADTGRCLATSVAITVAFDLEARRAVSFSEEDVARMGTHVVAGPTL